MDSQVDAVAKATASHKGEPGFSHGGHSGWVVSLLASHQGEPGSISGRVTGFSQVGIVPDDAIGQLLLRLRCRAVSPLASHQGEPGSIPGRVKRFSQVGIVPNDAVGRRVFSGTPVSLAISFRRCSILTSIILDFRDWMILIVTYCKSLCPRITDTQCRSYLYSDWPSQNSPSSYKSIPPDPTLCFVAFIISPPSTNGEPS
ncbi:hypothetical protein PR048_031529 [Dryococelus australis]|uniref:Uncharacterized protein n=1 Tax=Dryococelus australis TaxID=614101 RepID=A0ABQ9G5J6_9NEOP|nr:hypothetical protein PR048_031529 [Dryococelus australis]